MKPDHKAAIELMVEHLIQSTPQDVVSFEDLEDMLGISIRGSNRHLLQRALDILLSDHDAVFENVRNVGYRRLTDAEIVESRKPMAKVRSAANRGMRKLSCVEYDKLTRGEQTLHNARMATLNLARMVSTEHTVKTIDNRIANNGGLSDETIKGSLRRLVRSLG